MSNIYIDYESKGDRNKTLWVEKYLNTTRSYLITYLIQLEHTINNLKNCHVENSMNNSN